MTISNGEKKPGATGVTETAAQEPATGKKSLSEAIEAAAKKPMARSNPVTLSLREKLIELLLDTFEFVKNGGRLYEAEEKNYQELKGILISSFIGIRRHLEDDGKKVPRKSFQAVEDASKSFARVLAEAITSSVEKNPPPKATSTEGVSLPSVGKVLDAVGDLFKAPNK